MSEQGRLRLLVGGEGALRFGVPLDKVESVKEWSELDSPRRVVDLPRLFDLPTAEASDDRYAKVEGLDETAYMRLGPSAKAESLPRSRVQSIPMVLGTVAARWGWDSIVAHDDGVIVVVDPVSLGRIGARREEAQE